MARKESNTVEYFPHIAKSGKTIFILKSRWQNNGYAFWFQLLEVLCLTENHCYNCQTEESWQYLLAYTGVDENTGKEILDLLAKLGNIDTFLWRKRLIWCQKLVNNMDEVYKKRKRPLPSKPILGTNNAIPDTSNSLTGAEIPQSKVDKIKEDKRRVDNTTHNFPVIKKDESSSSSPEEGYDNLSIFQVYEENIGELTPVIEAELKEALKKFSDTQIAEAIALAVKSGPDKKNWLYIAGILKNWEREGYKPAKGDKRTAIAPALARAWTGETPLPADTNAQAHWNKALAELETQVSKANYHTWLKNTIGLRRSNGEFIIGVPNISVANYLEKNICSLIERTLTVILGEPANMRIYVMERQK